MINLTDLGLDKKILQKYVADGWISERKHPLYDLWIYNYTHKTQYANGWNPYTVQCRGLILDANDNVIARPFSKFFNYSQHDGIKLPKIPDLSYTVYEKLDGWLGILYRQPDGELAISTRGSFESEGAVEATRILRRDYADYPFEPHLTYLFEIITPTTRIVVDYGGISDLFLLDIIDNNTGRSVLDLELVSSNNQFPFPRATSYGMINMDYVNLQRGDEHEGYVLRFADDTRVKIKHEEYTRLHRILTNTSSTVVWEAVVADGLVGSFPGITAEQVGGAVRSFDRTRLATLLALDGKALDSLIEKVPDEFYEWVKQTAANISAQYECLMKMATYVNENSTDRRQIIELSEGDKAVQFIAFSLCDRKFILAHGSAWNLARPKWSKPFTNDEGA